VLSHRPRERMLEIMKDSRVGAMGVIAGVLLLLTKFAALAALLENGLEGDGIGWLFALACIPAWSRWWMATAIAAWPYARQSEGMGALFRGVKVRHIAASAVLSTILTALAILLSNPTSPSATLLAVMPVAAVVLGLALGWWLYRKLGGQTGDTYGAMNEWVEAGLLLLLAGTLA